MRRSGNVRRHDRLLYRMGKTGKLQSVKITPPARRIPEHYEASLRCLEAHALATVYPKASNPLAFGLWKLKKGTQLRQVLGFWLARTLSAHALDAERAAGVLLALVEAAEAPGAS